MSPAVSVGVASGVALRVELPLGSGLTTTMSVIGRDTARTGKQLREELITALRPGCCALLERLPEE